MGRVLVLIAAIAVSATPARAVEKKAIDRAVDNGVALLRNGQDRTGAWASNAGATALSALTLLECGADKDDKAVQAAAAYLRAEGLRMVDTYALALSVLFLDRLDAKTDTPLIESMVLRLLDGQQAVGNWTYRVPGITVEEAQRVKAEMDVTRVLRGSRDLSKLPAKGKRAMSDLPKDVQMRLVANNRGKGGPVADGDHSNTQFAVLALWVGRRYGIPTQGALLRVDRYFRRVQRPDGGWPYTPVPTDISTPTMTCAGLIGLAMGHGANLDVRKARNPKLESADVSKDDRIKAGLMALGTAVGRPTGWTGTGRPAVNIQTAEGKAFYFLWSLERVAVAYNLATIAKKDWYQWGAEVLLANQKTDGSWAGEYSHYGADTCFALLFLKRANFTRDLSTALSGGKKLDLVLKAGGVGGSSLRGPVKAFTPSDVIGAKSRSSGDSRPPDRSPAKPRTATEAAAARLTDDLVKAGAEQRTALLKKLRDTRGAEYTEALAGVIGRLDGDVRRKAREALTDRLTRMKATTLREYFKDEDVEIRRAAALAAAQQDSKSLIPDLIRLLSDPQSLVERAAHAALKELTGKNFGPNSGADRAERAKAIAAWEVWWKSKTRE